MHYYGLPSRAKLNFSKILRFTVCHSNFAFSTIDPHPIVHIQPLFSPSLHLCMRRHPSIYHKRDLSSSGSFALLNVLSAGCKYNRTRSHHSSCTEHAEMRKQKVPPPSTNALGNSLQYSEMGENTCTSWQLPKEV